MRITFLLPQLFRVPVGGCHVVYEYANHLAARGHEVTVVHPRLLPRHLAPPPPNLYRWLRRKGAQLRDRVLPAKIGWQWVDERVKFVIVPEPAPRYLPDADAVFATWWATAEYVVEFPASKGEKFYLVQGYETWGGPKARVDATWKMPLHKVVVSSWLYDLATRMGCEGIVKVPNGLDHSRFKVSTAISDRPKRVAMMFSHAEWKGSADGVTALQQVKSKHLDLEAVLFGIPPRPQYLPSWIQYYRNPPQRGLVRNIYNSARIFVCPSWTEGLPFPPAEAMACGCAVVTTDCGGVREYAEDGVTALLSPPRDPEALAKNLLRLLEDDDLRIRIALEGHKRIQAFTWERSTDLLEEFINARLGRRQS